MACQSCPPFLSEAMLERKVCLGISLLISFYKSFPKKNLDLTDLCVTSQYGGIKMAIYWLTFDVL